MKKGWIAVDFDGTLAVWHGNFDVMGAPIRPMVARVKEWLAAGWEVRIFTARVSYKDQAKVAQVKQVMTEWCVTHIGQKLEITNVKDFNMIELWDDKAITVIKNTGMSWREYIKRKRRT